VNARASTTLAATFLVLLAAACGGSPKAPTGSPSLRFARCMRSNGVSAYPDPGSGGQLVKASLHQLGVSSSRFASARNACRSLLPNGGRPPSRSAQLLVAAQSLRFSRCIRAHGVPGFPDPGSDGRIPDPASVGIDQGSPTFEAANDACGRYRPPYMPSNAAYTTWARTHSSGS
jgi:hypothetical protein